MFGVGSVEPRVLTRKSTHWRLRRPPLHQINSQVSPTRSLCRSSTLDSGSFRSLAFADRLLNSRFLPLNFSFCLLLHYRSDSDKKYTRVFGFARNNGRQGYFTGSGKTELAPTREETMEDLAPFFSQERHEQGAEKTIKDSQGSPVVGQSDKTQ
jgi:hypothetical protein